MRTIVVKLKPEPHEVSSWIEHRMRQSDIREALLMARLSRNSNQWDKAVQGLSAGECTEVL